MREFKSIEEKIIDWHSDRNLIHGATDWSQTSKLLEEFTELVASQLPGATPDDISEEIRCMLKKLLESGRIKTVPDGKEVGAKLDAIGDMAVVMVNIAERNSASLTTCMNLAYNEIKDRKGIMRGGTFIKEEDL